MGRVLLLAAAAVLFVMPASAQAATYYVGAHGSDAHAGTSPSTAWRTVARVNNAHLGAGDVVLFQGGAAFEDTTLMPTGSGTARTPIVFGSFGRGRATIGNDKGAVWFAGAHHLVFERLRLTSNGGSASVFAGSQSGGSTDITLRDSVVTRTAGAGVIAPSSADAHWTITRTRISHTGDSGLIMLGSGHLITKNTILDTGEDSSIPYARHGIYSKGPNQTISGNDFSHNFGGQSISTRFHGARVVGNKIHDTLYGIGFFDDDVATGPQGTSWFSGNQLWNISGWAFYYSGERDPNGALPGVNFVISHNTFRLSGASVAIDVSESGSARVLVTRNVASGTYGSALRAAATTVQQQNVWRSGVH